MEMEMETETENKNQPPAATPEAAKEKKPKKIKTEKPVTEKVPLKEIHPKINFFNAKNQFIVEMELPGIRTKDIQLVVTVSTLTIKGKKVEDAPLKNLVDSILEREYGRFEKKIELPDEINVKKVKGSLRRGVFRVRMPKKNITTRRHKIKLK